MFSCVWKHVLFKLLFIKWLFQNSYERTISLNGFWLRNSHKVNIYLKNLLSKNSSLLSTMIKMILTYSFIQKSLDYGVLFYNLHSNKFSYLFLMGLMDHTFHLLLPYILCLNVAQRRYMEKRNSLSNLVNTNMYMMCLSNNCHLLKSVF